MILTRTLKGIRPIIMHNGQMADPLGEHSKALKRISSKRNKTDEDHLAMAEIEFRAGLYWHKELGVYMPCENLQRMILDAAKKVKKGRMCSGVQVDAGDLPGFAITFKGSKNLTELQANPDLRLRKMVTVGTAKVMRTRPLIPSGWICKITIELDATDLNPEEFDEILAIAGLKIGIGDWRPGAPKVPGTFGKFLIEKDEVTK